MILNKILIDTNVCLDVALERPRFVVKSSRVLQACEESEMAGFVAAHSFDTLFYILSKSYSKNETYDAIEGLRRIVEPANVSRSVIDKALNLKWDDFEDAIHYQTALQTGCEAIITRNKKDFKQSDLPVYSPAEFLATYFPSDEED